MIMVVDLSIILYAHYFVTLKYADVSDKKRYAKSVATGIANLQLKLMDAGLPIKKIILCADLDTPWRTKIFKGYKDRHGDEAARAKYHRLATYCTKQLKKRHRVLEQSGIEADDWMFLLSHYGKKIVIVTADNDAALMADKKAKWWHYHRKELITNIDWEYEYVSKIVRGCPTDTLPKSISNNRIYEKDVKQLVGCSSDFDKLFDKAHELGMDMDWDDGYRNLMLGTYSIAIYKRHLKDFKKIKKKVLSML